MLLSEKNKRKLKTCIKNSIKENNFIKKQNIVNAVKRLISRYLSHCHFENKIKKEINKLIKYNENDESEWSKIKKNEKGEEIIALNAINVKIGQSLDFFELILIN